MANVDWIKIKTEYETTNTSYRKIATKYDVSFPTLRDRAKREDWIKSKKETRDKIIAKTLQKTVTKIADKISNRNARILDISDLATDAVEEYFKEKHYKQHVNKDNEGQIITTELIIADSKSLSNMVTALDKLQKSQRLSEGLLTVVEQQQIANSKHKIKLDNELLAIKQKEFERDNY